MQPCIVKQPIHDAKGDVWAYELLYSKGGPTASISEDPVSDREAAAALQGLLLQCNTENFLDDKRVFVTFTENLLRQGVPRIFSPEALVLQIDHDFLLLPDAMHMVSSYRDEGYKVALVGFDFNTMYLTALNTVDYVKLSYSSPAADHGGALDVLRGLGKTPIAYNVNDPDAFNRAFAHRISYMQGRHISSAMPTEAAGMDLMASNFFRLIVAITKPEPNFDEIEGIIARDVTLTYSLLKLVNSAFFALRTRVTSVHHALVVLGISQLKQWIYLLSFNPDGKAPLEFIKTSLMRGSFCEALCGCIKDMPITPSEAYLMGLFSTLGSLLNTSMDKALGQLNLSDEIVAALLTGEGRCGALYKLVLSYERADWFASTEYAEELGLEQNVIAQKYMECTDAVGQSWRQITQAM